MGKYDCGMCGYGVPCEAWIREHETKGKGEMTTTKKKATSKRPRARKASRAALVRACAEACVRHGNEQTVYSSNGCIRAGWALRDYDKLVPLPAKRKARK